MTQEIGSVMERKFLVEVVRALSQKVVKSAQKNEKVLLSTVKTTFVVKCTSTTKEQSSSIATDLLIIRASDQEILKLKELLNQ